MKTILFYPDEIRGGRVLWAVKKAGYLWHNDPEKPYDVFIYWSYHRTKEPPDPIAVEHRAVNWRLFDITKSRVNDVYNDININPLTYQKQAVRKTESQGSHSGCIINCPISRMQYNPQLVYQKYIETRVGGLYTSYRLFYDGEVRFVAKKYKKSPFKSDHVLIEKYHPLDIFTRMHLDTIQKKSIIFGLEFGEIDILRDVRDGRSYVVDINNVPGMGNLIMDEIGDAYLEMFCNFVNTYKKER
jgi:hypothetical protein